MDFVRTAIKAVGRVAVKLENAGPKMDVLLELIKARVPYVVQAAVVVVANIFRRYPNRYESIIGALCENLESSRRAGSQRSDDLDRRGICGFDRERR